MLSRSEKHCQGNSSETAQSRGWEAGARRAGGQPARGRGAASRESPVRLDGAQDRGGQCVYNIYLHLIYRTSIYRYKRNQQNCRETIPTLLWLLLRMSEVEQLGWAWLRSGPAECLGASQGK